METAVEWPSEGNGLDDARSHTARDTVDYLHNENVYLPYDLPNRQMLIPENNCGMISIDRYVNVNVNVNASATVTRMAGVGQDSTSSAPISYS